MITNRGRAALVQHLSGVGTPFGEFIVLGVGSVAATANDVTLASESVRVPVVLRSPDYVNNQVIFKGTIPSEVAGEFYEVGISLGKDRMVSPVVFGQITEVWTNGVPDPANSRYGSSSIRVDAAASGSKSASTDQSFSIGSGDEVGINYFVGSNVSSAYVRLLTDTSNYFHFALPVTPGYNSVFVPITSFTATGSPTPDNLSSVVVFLASTAGGASQLYIDSISVIQNPTDEVLLARQVLAQPIVKDAGIEMDIEFPVGVSV